MKKFSLQFLPDQLEHLTKSKYFSYKEHKLKSDYAIDIVHNLLLKYYFKEENYFSLSSLILKEKYGNKYNHYINYLEENKIINLYKNYLVGHNTKIYSLNPTIIKHNIKRYKNSDKYLIKKYLSKKYDYKNNLIHKEIKEKLVKDLHEVTIQLDKSITYINTLKNKDSYNKNIYSVESIVGNHIFYNFDNYGRFHTNFTILKSYIRKNCLLIDGEETYEIDLKNSQPLFLSKLIKDSGNECVDKEELKLFSNLVMDGTYYQYLMNHLSLKNKNDAKKLTYKVFFGKNMKNSIYDQLFSSIFPTIHNFIILYKKDHFDYRVLSHHLQEAESNLIFNVIVKEIMIKYPYIKIITIHDSLIIKQRYMKEVSEIFYSKVNEFFNKFEHIYNSRNF